MNDHHSATKPPVRQRTRSGLKLRDLIVAALGFVSFSLIENIGKAFDVWEKAELAFGWKPDALEISRAGDREHFTRDLLQLAFKRWYLSRNFGDLVSDGRPASELDEAWRSYEAASLNWEELLVVNSLGINKWYGAEKARYLEQVIEPIFTQVNWCMDDLRMNGKHPVAQSNQACNKGFVYDDQQTNVVFLRIVTNNLYLHLHCFAAGVAPPPVVTRGAQNATASVCPESQR